MTTTATTHPYCERFAAPLPREFAHESAHLNWSDFCSTYAPADGPLALRNWSSRSLGRGLHRFEARFADDRAASATASGAIRATSDMLHDLGYPLEIERFTQHGEGGQFSTVIRATGRHGRSTWAVGFGDTGPQSATQAMLSAIARLY